VTIQTPIYTAERANNNAITAVGLDNYNRGRRKRHQVSYVRLSIRNYTSLRERIDTRARDGRQVSGRIDRVKCTLNCVVPRRPAYSRSVFTNKSHAYSEVTTLSVLLSEVTNTAETCGPYNVDIFYTGDTIDRT